MNKRKQQNDLIQGFIICTNEDFIIFCKWFTANEGNYKWIKTLFNY